MQAMQRNPWWRVIAIAPFAWVGVVLVLATLHAYPQTDDYCTFARLYASSGDNPFAETWHMYMHWSGRWSANFSASFVGWLASVVPLPLQWVYAATLSLFIAGFAWACLAMSSLLREDGRAAPVTAFVMFGASLALMPSKLEGVLWLTGVAVYSLGLVAVPFLFRSVRRDTEAGPGTFSWTTIALIGIATGFNEFIGMVVGGFLVLRMLISVRGREHRRQHIVLLAAWAIFFAATVLAPGNFLRDATISTQRHALGPAMTLAWQNLLVFVGSHVYPYVALLFALAIAAFVSGWCLGGARRSLRGIAPEVIACVLMFPGHYLVYSYLAGDAVPGRVINQAYALALLGGLGLLAWCGARAAQWRVARNERKALLVVAVAGLMLVTSPHVRSVATTTRDYGPIWRAAQEARAAHFRAARAAGGPVVVAPLPPENAAGAPLYQGADVTNDPAYWINSCVADYERIPQVTLQAAPAQ